MGLFDKVKNAFNRIFKKDQKLQLEEAFGKDIADEILSSAEVSAPKKEEYVPLDLPEGEIVPMTDGEVLDVDSPEAIQKFKHNLEILMRDAKEKGKIDKFMIIREDDFFPDDWEWRVLSKDTNLEGVSTGLSYELRKAYALEQSGVKPFIDVMGMKVPNGSRDEILSAMSKVDKTIGNVMLPSRFRSTKHFTLNTPLGVTGNYNTVETDRDFIVMDNMDAFLASGYGYSVADHDAYLDVSHEALPISESAVALIADENYDRIMSDEKVAKQLAERRVVRFKGDEVIAIDMVLAEQGALPTRVGTRYAEYDQEMFDIIDSSIKGIAEENGLFHDRSHAGQLKAEGGGHFSNYYDDKNKDYEHAYQEFVEFLKSKFPGQEDLFLGDINGARAQDIVERLGTTALLDAIGEYNDKAKEKVAESLEAYKQDRATITPQIHQIFTTTISLINDFYKQGEDYSSYEERTSTEEAIRSFLQSGTVQEQLDAARSVYEIMSERNKAKEENTVEQETSIENTEKQGEER